MKYEVEQSIYKISQDHDTFEIDFLVYGRVEKTISADRNLKHEELHEMLLQCVHEYQMRMRGEK